MDGLRNLAMGVKGLSVPKASALRARPSPPTGVIPLIKSSINRMVNNSLKKTFTPRELTERQTKMRAITQARRIKKQELLNKAKEADELIFSNKENIKLLLEKAPIGWDLKKFESTPHNKIFALELFKKAKLTQYGNLIKLQARVRGVSVRNKTKALINENRREKEIQEIFTDTMRKHRESMGRSGRNTPRFNSSGSRHSNSSRKSDGEVLFNTFRNKSLASNTSSSRYYSANSRQNSSLSNSIGRKTQSEIVRKKQSLKRKERVTV